MHSKTGASRSRGLTDLRGHYLLTFASWVFPTLATPAPTYHAGFGEEVFRLPLFPRPFITDLLEQGPACSLALHL
jgi:hypothetical protein